MKQKNLLTMTLLGGALAGTLLGLGATRLTPIAQAAPAKEATTAPNGTTAAPLADVFSGKTYPLTLPAEKIDSSYHLVGLVDAQGKPAQIATRGETVAVGGETFLICYDVPVTSAQTRPPQPKAGATGTLIYVNLRMVQAMGGIIPITPAEAVAPTAAPEK
jgi:hypothetical protein